MSEDGLKQARDLTSQGFFYENLMKMAQFCRQEKDPSRLVSAFILHHVFFGGLDTTIGRIRLQSVSNIYVGVLGASQRLHRRC